MSTYMERMAREERLRPVVPVRAATSETVKVWGFVRHVSGGESRRVEQRHSNGAVLLEYIGHEHKTYYTAAEFDAAGFILMEETGR